MRTHSRLTLIAAVMAAVVLLPASLVAAQSYDTPDGSVVVNDTTLRPGQPFTVTGSGFGPNTEVKVIFNSTPILLGTLTASETGTATGSFEVPDVEPGSHTIEMTGVDPSGAPLTRTVSVTVAGSRETAASSSPNSGASNARSLAFTGATSAAVALTGLLLVGGGVMLLQLRRRRSGTAS